VLVAVALSACSALPTADELDGAERARPDGLRALSGIEVPSLDGLSPVAERRMDACGSLTSDRDWDDNHVEGYSCAAVRRIVYEPAEPADRADLEPSARAAIATIQETFAPRVTDQDSAWFSVSDNVPTADARLLVDGLDTRVGMVVTPADAADIGMLPLWHRNVSIHQDDGELAGKLAAARIPDGPVFLVTVTVTYFDELRDDG